jgi:hypothetical protein
MAVKIMSYSFFSEISGVVWLSKVIAPLMGAKASG